MQICGTTLMNVGLLFVPVSVYQMLRGALVLWVGLFSVLFLGRKLPLAQWASLAIVMSGVAVVGLSNSFSTPAQTGEDGAPGPDVDVGKAVLGAALVLFAQIFTASQFVIEEKIMTRYSLEPLVSRGDRTAFSFHCAYRHSAARRRTRRHLWTRNDRSAHAGALCTVRSDLHWRRQQRVL